MRPTASARSRTVWMGSTLGCAECHDHKFDPFHSKDFYAMKAFFADINETGMARDGKGRKAGRVGHEADDADARENRRLEDLDRRDCGARGARGQDRGAREQRAPWDARRSSLQRGELAWKFQRPVAVSAQARP